MRARLWPFLASLIFQKATTYNKMPCLNKMKDKTSLVPAWPCEFSISIADEVISAVRGPWPACQSTTNLFHSDDIFTFKSQRVKLAACQRSFMRSQIGGSRTSPLKNLTHCSVDAICASSLHILSSLLDHCCTLELIPNQMNSILSDTQNGGLSEFHFELKQSVSLNKSTKITCFTCCFNNALPENLAGKCVIFLLVMQRPRELRSLQSLTNCKLTFYPQDLHINLGRQTKRETRNHWQGLDTQIIM